MRRLTILVLLLYAGINAYAILRIILNEPYFAFLTPLLALLACGFAILHAVQRVGWKRMLLLLGLCFGISLLFETIGVRTGIIFGTYYYTDQLGGKFLGLVPIIIPVAWFMMQYPSLLIAETMAGYTESPGSLFSPRIIRNKAQLNPLPAQDNLLKKASFSSILWVSALGGLIMTAWDLTLDPLMTTSGQWVWSGALSTRLYFGIPLQNFFGWWLTTFIIFSLYLLITRVGKVWKVANQEQSFSPPMELHIAGVTISSGFLSTWGYMSRAAFDRLAVLCYLTTALASIILNLLIGLGGSALVGLFAIAPWIIGVWSLLTDDTN